MILRLWTAAELDRLAAMLADSKPLEEIAQALGRTIGACDNKAREKGLRGIKRPPKQASRGLVRHLDREHKAEIGKHEARQDRPAGSQNRHYLAGLLEWNESRLEQAKAAAGPWADMDGPTRWEEVTLLAQTAAAVRAQLADWRPKS